MDAKQADVEMKDAAPPAAEIKAPEVKKEEEKPVDPRVAALREIVFNVVLLERSVISKEGRLVWRALRSTNGFRRKMTHAVVVEAIRRFIPESHPSYSALAALVSTTKVADEDNSWLSTEIAREQSVEQARLEKLEKSRHEEEEARKRMEAAVAKAKEAKETKEGDEARDDAEREKEKFEKESRQRKAERERHEEKKAHQARLRQHLVDGHLPEVELYIHLLVIIHLLERGTKDQAIDAVTVAMDSAKRFNRRTLDILTARLYSYFSLVYENAGRLEEIRSTLLDLHRIARQHHDEPGQATLINAILRNFIHFNLFSQADRFRAKVTMPESRSNGEHARYLYYTGHIHAIQLHYSDASNYLDQALRKAPQKGAVGFRLAVNKLLVIVKLFIGETPERSLFRDPDLKRSLLPYFKMTKAVRVGDLAAFNDVVVRFKNVFAKDKTNNLVVRLRHNVIKTGLRKIEAAYSRISLKDICAKLHLESEEDAEYIVAKAIHDNVIDAVIDRQNKFVFSRESVDRYSSSEPQAEFNRRIQFCMETYAGSVKAMRFPPNAFKKERINDDDNVDEDFEDA